MRLIAGVDSSTQSCKVVLRDLETGEVVREGRAAHPEGTEVDPAAWWTALGTALGAAGGLAEVEAIAVGGQQHGLVALAADGTVVRPALLWNDTRSARAASDLIAEVGADAYAARVGVVPVASFTATKLRWLRDVEPENAARVAAVALPHDWLSWRLRGYGPAGESPLGPDLEQLRTDRSDASGTAYWSAASGEYDAELFTVALGRPLRVAGEDGPEGDVVVPLVLRADQPMGALTVDVPVGDATAPAGLLVGAGAGDNAGAALGLGAVTGDVVVSIGTSGTVFAVAEHPTTDASGTVAGFADAAGQFLPLIATLNAARVLDAMSALLGVFHAEFGELALEASPGCDGLVLVPYLAGERTPNLPDATGSLTGLTSATMSRAHFARAAIEGMLCGLADGLEAVTATGVAAERLLLIGGAAQNDAVQRVAAQVFGLPVEVPAPGEYVALGAAVQAAWALTGERPAWTPSTTAALPADPRPGIRSAYAVAAASFTPGQATQ